MPIHESRTSFEQAQELFSKWRIVFTENDKIDGRCEEQQKHGDDRARIVYRIKNNLRQLFTIGINVDIGNGEKVLASIVTLLVDGLIEPNAEAANRIRRMKMEVFDVFATSDLRIFPDYLRLERPQPAANSIDHPIFK